MSSAVPDGWVSTTIGEATSEISDGGTPATSNAEYFNGSIPWIVIDDIQPRIVHTKSSITELGLQKSSAKLWDKGTIILSTGATIGEVGIAMKVMATKQGICGVVVKSDVSAKYFYHLLISKKRQLNILSQGSTIKETRPPTVKKIQICLPPLPEQKKIASILTSVDEVIENTQKQIDKLQDLKKATMNELLTKGIGHTEFKDSELGRIPKSWEVVELGELSDVTKLAGFEYTEHFDYSIGGEIIALRVLNLDGGKLDLTNIQTIPKSVSEALPRSKLFYGDILISYVGSIGDLGFIYDNDRFHLAPNVAKISCNLSKVSAQFILQQLLSARAQKNIEVLTTITSQPSLNMANIRKIRLLVCPLNEQDKIVEVLSSLDIKTDNLRNKLSQTQSLKKSLMQDLLTGKVRVTVN
ncbi:restriction endonuclease subunit S [bacterium]|nr:restriction endonuclease subunit S [bacterium]